MIAVITFALGAAFGAALALRLLRTGRQSDDELIERFQSDQTRALSEALRRLGVRGRCGELTLRNVVEAAGMSEHCDFSTQEYLADADARRKPSHSRVAFPLGVTSEMRTNQSVSGAVEDARSRTDSEPTTGRGSVCQTSFRSPRAIDRAGRTRATSGSGVDAPAAALLSSDARSAAAVPRWLAWIQVI